MTAKSTSATLFFAFALCSAAETSGTNFIERANESVKISAFAEVQSSYLARGKVVDKHPFSAQFANGELMLGDFGHIGAHVWSVTSFTGDGQSAQKRYAYNEADYNLHYVYDLELAEDWSLENRLARQWVTLPGYRGDAKTFCEWHVAHALRNPYVTPYYLMRHACRPNDWTYWCVGARKTIPITEDLSFTVDFFGDLGDARHFYDQYGAKPDEPKSHYHGGLQALNLVLRLDYSITEHIGIYAFIWQFDIVSDEARKAVKESAAHESRRDVTVGGVGISLNF
jgi:hypothetical protein